ncbi:porin [Prochlorococcus marinus]|uniref:porin n=1 Tax=Prochlorococcus marinus TaxID=1219 RepID=UPI001AD95BD5|nr:porin [Prochlorococcus marinus]MBO8219367.1 carbohydrate porin [Prochlorococcus marinus CUG1416]MBW3051748.1 porin [Prochlorococcus marinus str. MU1416]
MKLFKSLLIAPATLGLLAPMSATANELNIAEVSAYSSSEEVQNISEFYPKELAVTNSRVDGLEVRMNEIEAGSFSETTTASFSADFYLGAVDGGTSASNDPLMATYGFQIDLNTSFTGEDSLDISLDAGNTSTSTTSVTEFDGNATEDKLTVDGVSYTFPVGGATVFVADNGDGSALFTTACTYGGPTNTLDDCGNVNAGITLGGVATGASYDFGNGFSTAIGYQATEGEEAKGLMTEESTDKYALNGAYTGDNYGLSVTYANIEDGTKDDTFTALNGYYTPDGEGLPSISVGYEFGEDGNATSEDEITSFFVGLQWDEVGPGSLGVAMGHSNTVEGKDEEYMYEAYYSYPVNDGMTITPVVYTKESNVSGQDDATGVMVKTSFSF